MILLYDRISTCANIDKARLKLFTKKTDVKQIPPTRADLEQNVSRATYDGGHIEGQSLLATPELPLPTTWGWTKKQDGLYEPNWRNLHEPSKACYELYHASAKRGV